MMITPRLFRRAAYGGLLYIAVECFLFWLIAREVGILPMMAFVTLKGLVGFALFAGQLRAVFTGVALNPVRRGLSGLGSAGFGALGAFLILLPGVLTTLAGLALFAPSVRSLLLRWVRREKHRSARDEVITLDADEWRELGTRKKPRKRQTHPRELSP
ncbi:MAG: FxsA family protein [Proteobacteria bacterium]|nr:FxsA family protein [Pseudomonadota bacterium]